MEWQNLLCHERLKRPDATTQVGRSPFQQDIDRVVFSAAFRRLAHKTQVHPLAANDHVHTRLTHSIEVASVGRSLGTMTGAMICRSTGLPEVSGDTFGYVVQAACLAHDIGNPPFGHSGEMAIRDWFSSAAKGRAMTDELAAVEREDFRNFEGNAQGFRILTQLENNPSNGGLQLTFAVLGTFSKYPRSSIVRPDDDYVGAKKVGFFESERHYFSETAEKLGLCRRRAGEETWCRHPLAFLVEAADDICYAIIDIEDGYQLGYLDFQAAKTVLEPIAGDSANLSSPMDEIDQIGKLRAVAIGVLIDDVSRAFEENQSSLLAGTFSTDLLRVGRFGAHIEGAKELAQRKLYWSDRKTKLEIAGSEVISGLLEIFSQLVGDLKSKRFDHSQLPERSARLLRTIGNPIKAAKTPYDALMCVTDYISGMTDRYAVETYRVLKGITT